MGGTELLWDNGMKVNKKSLNARLVFHIPCYVWTELGLVEIDYHSFKDALEIAFDKAGFISRYIIKAISSFKGNEYGEELCTMFCSEDMVPKAVEIFRVTVVNYHKFMKQEIYSYEYNNTINYFEV